MASRRVGVVVLVAMLAGCAVSRPFGKLGGNADGPLVALTGHGATLGPALKPGKHSATWTFGSPLCSDDPDAEILIDDVSYDVVPSLDVTGDPDRPSQPLIRTWFRSIPTPAEAGDDATPIIAVRGGPMRLIGEVRELGDGLPSPIDRPCDGYDDEDRTWPVVELLTVMTVGRPGAIARHTYIDYHVGDDDYTETIDWQVGFCGPAIPAGLGCGRN